MSSRRLVIIPARGGSTRLPDKNIQELNGKPLVEYTIDLALEYFTSKEDLIVVSTDSGKYINLLWGDYCNNPSRLMIHLRPSHLATNTSKVIDTVRYYVDWYQTSEQRTFDKVFLMLPTCPIKTVDDIAEVDTLLNKNVDSVVTVRPFEFPIELALRLDAGLMIERNENYIKDNTRSQDFVKTYHPNGAVYASRWESFLKHRNFFAGNVRAYIMTGQGVDIDTAEDFKLAERLMRKK